MANKNLQMLADLKKAAARQVIQYPQYVGHFEGYTLARVKRDIRTKMGLAFARDEFALMAPAPRATGTPGFVTAWSIRNQIDTSVRARDLEIVEAAS